MRVWLSNIRGDKTQSEVAQKIGISQNYYSMIESGQRTPSVVLAKKMGMVMNFNWPLFFEDAQRTEPNQNDQPLP